MLGTVVVGSLFLFDTAPPERPAEDADSTPVKERAEDERILCARCGGGVTSRREKIKRADSFEHVFANPSGFVYRLGCFGRAPGCLEQGDRTDFFSWFRGYAWSFARCRHCLAHLGWLFSSADDVFFGLILDRLKNCSSDA